MFAKCSFILFGLFVCFVFVRAVMTFAHAMKHVFRSSEMVELEEADESRVADMQTSSSYIKRMQNRRRSILWQIGVGIKSGGGD